MLDLLLILSTIVLLAFFVKGVSGFGAALVIIPLSLPLVDIKLILPVSLILLLIGGFYQLYVFWRYNI